MKQVSDKNSSFLSRNSWIRTLASSGGTVSNIQLSLYALFVAAPLSSVIKPGSFGIFTGIFGLLIYTGEYFSFRTKLNMIKLRSEIQRRKLSEELGYNAAVPQAGCVLTYGFLMRMVFRVGIGLLSLASLGIIPAQETTKDSPVFLIILACGIVLFEIFTMVMMMVDPSVSGVPSKKYRYLEEEEAKQKQWLEKNIPLVNSDRFIRNEFFADLVLQVYVFMFYTYAWQEMNKTGIEYVVSASKDGSSAGATFLFLVFLVSVMVMFFFIPIRLHFWIEQSITAITPRQRWIYRGTLLLAAVSTCLPILRSFFELFVLK